ncbi:hypothetical protein MHYP_G00347030 [Metynnis hypsauchen]
MPHLRSRNRTAVTDTTDYSGYMAVMALAHVLPPAVLFDHPRNIPRLPHIILHLFGSSGLSVVTSLTLALELILKSVSQSRTRSPAKSRQLKRRPCREQVLAVQQDTHRGKGMDAIKERPKT